MPYNSGQKIASLDDIPGAAAQVEVARLLGYKAFQPKKVLRIIKCGDSMSGTGYSDTWSIVFSTQVEVIDAWHGGFTIDQIDAAFDTDVVPWAPITTLVPTHAFVQMGINNVANSGDDAATVVSKILAYCAKLLALGFSFTIITICDYSGLTSEQQTIRAEANDALEAAARAGGFNCARFDVLAGAASSPNYVDQGYFIHLASEMNRVAGKSLLLGGRYEVKELYNDPPVFTGLAADGDISGTSGVNADTTAAIAAGGGGGSPTTLRISTDGGPGFSGGPAGELVLMAAGNVFVLQCYDRIENHYIDTRVDASSWGVLIDGVNLALSVANSGAASFSGAVTVPLMKAGGFPQYADNAEALADGRDTGDAYMNTSTTPPGALYGVI